MDAELKQYLVDGGADRLLHQGLRERENERSELVKEYVNERSENVEAKLLTELHRSESPAEARSRMIAVALRAIDLEKESMDALAKKLEGRPPQ